MGRAAGGGVGGRGGRISGGREGMGEGLGSLGRTKRGGWGAGVVLGFGGGGVGLLLLASEIVGGREEVGGEVGDGGEEDMIMGSVSKGLGRRRLDGG